MEETLKPNLNEYSQKKEVIDEWAAIPKDMKQCLEHYTKYSHLYDDIHKTLGYNEPHHVVKCMLSYDFSKDIEICDFGCGTGTAGIELKEAGGFNNLYGLDGSEGMVEQCKKIGVYKEVGVNMVGTDPLPPHYIEKFDVAVVCGCYYFGHFPKEATRTILSSIKSKGYYFFSIRDNIEGEPSLGYGEDFQKLKEEGEIEELQRIPFVKWQGMKPKENEPQTYYETPSHVVVFRKLK